MTDALGALPRGIDHIGLTMPDPDVASACLRDGPGALRRIVPAGAG